MGRGFFEEGEPLSGSNCRCRENYSNSSCPSAVSTPLFPTTGVFSPTRLFVSAWFSFHCDESTGPQGHLCLWRLSGLPVRMILLVCMHSDRHTHTHTEPASRLPRTRNSNLVWFENDTIIKIENKCKCEKCNVSHSEG